MLLDEPENHLHPALQRALLPGFVEAFPKVQFITATHNPFIVGSVPDSTVYVLRYDQERRVNSVELDTVNKAGSANEILRDALGLEFTMPLWAERRLEQITDAYVGEPITRNSLRRLREEMKQLGMEHAFPEAVAQVLDEDQR